MKKIKKSTNLIKIGQNWVRNRLKLNENELKIEKRLKTFKSRKKKEAKNWVKID